MLTKRQREKGRQSRLQWFSIQVHLWRVWCKPIIKGLTKEEKSSLGITSEKDFDHGVAVSEKDIEIMKTFRRSIDNLIEDDKYVIYEDDDILLHFKGNARFSNVIESMEFITKSDGQTQYLDGTINFVSTGQSSFRRQLKFPSISSRSGGIVSLPSMI